MIANDSTSTHQLVSEPATAGSTGSASLPLYPSLSDNPSAFALSEFLSRPVCMYTYTGTGTIATLLTETYACDYIALTSIQQKLKYLKLVRGTFKVDFLLTTSPYALGQIVCAFYMGAPASTSIVTTDPTTFAFWLSCKDRVILDPSNMTTGTISIPMHIEFPFTDVAAALPDVSLADMRMSLATLAPIVDASTGTNTSYTIKIFVSMVNPEITVPVIHDAGSIYTSEVQQTASGPVSSIATIVEKVGKTFSKVPVIGKFAYATSIAAGAVSSIAKLFGFSRPRDITPFAYPHEEDYSSYVGNIRTKTLTVDPMAEIPIDNSFLGESGDNLTYENTIQREGILSTFTWSKTDAERKSLWYVAVTPVSSYLNNAMYYSPPVSYVSQMFSIWRGTLVYRIVVPSNRYVRGKLRIFWSPTQMTSSTFTSAEYLDISQNATSVILDLSSSSEVVIEVPYAQREPYRCVDSLWEDGLGGHSNTFEGHNGYLYFMVEEPLLAAASTLTLNALIWVSAAEDFQFAIPTQGNLMYLHRQAYGAFGAVDTVVDPGVSTLYPNPMVTSTAPVDSLAENWTTYTAEVVSNTMNPGIKKVITLLPSTDSSDVAALHLGEEFGSLRNFLKRFYANYSPVTSTVTSQFGWFLPYLPLEPFMRLNTGVTYYPFALQTPLRYISNLFYGVRGTIRIRVAVRSIFTGASTFTFHRAFYPLLSILQPNVAIATKNFSWIWAQVYSASGQAGYKTYNGEPIVVDVPYQCNRQFQTTEVQLPPSTGYATNQYGVLASPWDNGPNQYEFWYAAGEDFMPVIWNGTPLLSVFTPGQLVG